MLGWHYTNSGLYTIKSGYWLAMHSREDEEIIPPVGSLELKDRVWKLKTTPNV